MIRVVIADLGWLFVVDTKEYVGYGGKETIEKERGGDFSDKELSHLLTVIRRCSSHQVLSLQVPVYQTDRL